MENLALSAEKGRRLRFAVGMLLVAVAIGLGLLGTISLTFRLLSGVSIDVGTRILLSGAVLATCAAVSVFAGGVVGGLFAFALGLIGGAASIRIVLIGQGDVFATSIFPALMGAVSLALVVGSARLVRHDVGRRAWQADAVVLLSGLVLVTLVWVLPPA